MDIVYSSSDTYAFLTGISIISLFENNKDVNRIRVFIMDNKISKENKEKLSSIGPLYSREIVFVDFPDVEKITGRHIDTGRWNLSTFGRLFMASVLPVDVHYALNIDCDTIVMGSLKDIFESFNTNDFVFGGVSECINYRYKRNIGLNNDDKYFNGGLVFLNLDRIRIGDTEKKFVDYIATYGDSLSYLDQDVINSIIPENDKKEMPLKYDMLSPYFYLSYNQIKKSRMCKSFYTRAEYDAAVNNPIIIHFTSFFLDGLRPWIEGNRHPFLSTFLSYKEKSPWKDVPLWKDERKTSKKMLSAILKSFPRCILLPIAGLVHGVVVPNKSRKKMKVARINYGSD